MKHAEITERVIAAFYKVYNTLGYGFLEKVYQNAMVIELRRMGLHVEPQARIDVYYENEKVGEYFADILVNSCGIAEQKGGEKLRPEHHAQFFNSLKASSIEVGFLLNFGPKPKIKQKVMEKNPPVEDFPVF